MTGTSILTGSAKENYQLNHVGPEDFPFYLFVLRFYGSVNPNGSCRAWLIYLTVLLLDRLSPLMVPSSVHILSPEKFPF